MDRRGILVLNDTNYPGWKAYVDGKEASILSANYSISKHVLFESEEPPVSDRAVL